MGLINLISILLPAIVIMINGQSVTEEMLATLLAKIEAVEATNVNYNNQITTLENQLADIAAAEDANIGAANSRMNTIEGNLNTVKSNLNVVESQIQTIEGQIVALAQSLGGVQSSITKLQNVNAIWRQNWVVVNKTFREIKTKLKFRFATPIRLPVVIVRRG